LLIFFVGSSSPITRADAWELSLRHGERIAIHRVEPLGDISCELEVLRLVIAHGHDRGVVQQNIGGHQHRVLQQPVTHARKLVVLAFRRFGLRLELRHPV
jgi:hypothetical protein